MQVIVLFYHFSTFYTKQGWYANLASEIRNDVPWKVPENFPRMPKMAREAKSSIPWRFTETRTEK